ncbi:transcriptional regulator [Pseudomonas fluorescens HK44]|uniref:Transcriptional regulator n=1 Tax=Pseudomonas fluorescens HK44 TaxID=1042209 RepID=A0A010S1M6_PSEFL|nr:transcriptional regulator [Pseudomonas fluorescens HK44]
MRVMQKHNVSTVLRALLNQHGISPAELHRRTGVPQSTLSRILSRKIADPSDKHISKIAEYFRVSTAQLRGRADVALASAPAGEESHSELKGIRLWDDDTPLKSSGRF